MFLGGVGIPGIGGIVGTFDIRDIFDIGRIVDILDYIDIVGNVDILGVYVGVDMVRMVGHDTSIWISSSVLNWHVDCVLRYRAKHAGKHIACHIERVVA